MTQTRTGRWLAGLGLVWFTGQVLAQGTLQPVTITFEGEPYQPPSSSFRTYSYSESGMVFTSLNDTGFSRVGAGNSHSADNGTPCYVRALAGDSLSFVYGSGALFDLNSVDLAEYSTVVPDAQTVHFIGYHADGSTIEADFRTDGIFDGTGPLADFQTFNFTGWNNLTRVDIPTDGYSLDNLVFTPAPEPGTLALGVVGLGALGYAARRRR